MISLGLTSRAYAHLLPQYIAENAGDILWAMMVYCGIRFLFTNKPPQLAMLISLIFCFGIEFSQMYHEEWIDNIRRTTLGALILGRGFLIVDLWRYSIGVLFSFLLDRSIMKGVKRPFT